MPQAILIAPSIRVDVVAPHDIAPAIDLAYEKFLQRLRTARGEIHPEGFGQLPAQVRLVQHLAQRGRELVEDRLRSAGPPPPTPPTQPRHHPKPLTPLRPHS